MGRIGELEVHNTARFAAAQDNVDYGAQFIVSVLLAGVFDELHTQYVFGSDGRYLLVCHFNAVDTGLYGPTTADAHAVAQIVHLQTGNAEIVQQVVGTERAFELAFGRQDDLPVYPLQHIAGRYRHFTEAHGIFLQLYIAQVEAFIQFQQYVFTLEADKGDGKAVIACLDFREGELALCIRGYSGHQSRVYGP